MSTTTHPFAPEEIMAHLDGELSPAQSQSVSTHIESCSECSSLATSLRSSSQSLASWRVSPVPSQFQERVLAASTSTPRSFQGLNPFDLFDLGSRMRKGWVLGVIAAGCALVFLFLISTRNRNAYDSALYASKPKMVNPQSAPQTATGHGDGLGPKSREALEMRNADAATTSTNGRLVDSARANSEEQQQDADRLSSKYYSQALSAPAPPASTLALEEFKVLVPEQGKNRESGLTFSGPMIARTVSLSLIAKDFDSSRSSLDAILARHNGYAAYHSVSTPQDAARLLQASLRIPAPQLPSALAELKSLGRVELENQNGEEVTQQHADLVARLKNSRETEQRLQAILTQRTGKISDVLEVEQEIARVRGEIEQMEAEQKNLEHRVDFATIDLKLSEEYKAKLDSPAPAISTLIHNAAVNGYRNVADTLLSIALFFAEYGPVLTFWLLMLAVPAWLIRRRWRHATAII